MFIVEAHVQTLALSNQRISSKRSSFDFAEDAQIGSLSVPCTQSPLVDGCSNLHCHVCGISQEPWMVGLGNALASRVEP